MRMDGIVAQCPGVLAIHNDVFIYGKDDKDHDANIINLFSVAPKGLIFNSKKCAIKQESVTFFGGVFSTQGYSPDPEKIQGISEMTPPQTRQELVLPQCSELSADFHSSSQLQYRAPLGPPQKGEQLCLGWEFQHVLPENQDSPADGPPETPQILWSEQTSHPSVWCLTQGARSLHHPGWTPHSLCKQVPHGERPIMPTLRESSWPLYMAVKSSIHTCIGHSSWRWTTSPSRWSTWRIS